ncbi:lipopolysaccharide-induced tumor necrosis factor-alpha factor homolog-like [Osmerus eperlanus]|uniref:lipopolysaccharide-induced tumor necrosis factor-alpha factor homolog-like n=1 Tax=Osmerus eperlanus TaxID=29151 RepID=UPI002E0F5BAE
MSTGGANPPPYIIPVGGEQGGDVKVYHVHQPFTPCHLPDDQIPTEVQAIPVYATSGAPTKNKFVSYETELGRTSGRTTCTGCKQQVNTDVTYKVGAFAWLMCFVFILCGLVVGCCLIPFFVKHFKDAYHSCPQCHQILYVDKKRCC